jgi:hypothetical protein
MILSFHYAQDSAQGLGGDCGEPQNTDLHMGATRWEVRHTSDEEMPMRGERERARYQCAAKWAVKMRGVETPTRSTNSGEGEVESGATLPPSYPLCTNPLHRDVLPR